MILSVSIDANRYPALVQESLKYGVSCDHVETDEDAGTVYADLHADAHRAIKVSLRVGAKRLTVVDQIEHREPLMSRSVRRTVFR